MLAVTYVVFCLQKPPDYLSNCALNLSYFAVKFVKHLYQYTVYIIKSMQSPVTYMHGDNYSSILHLLGINKLR